MWSIRFDFSSKVTSACEPDTDLAIHSTFKISSKSHGSSTTKSTDMKPQGYNKFYDISIIVVRTTRIRHLYYAALRLVIFPKTDVFY